MKQIQWLSIKGTPNEDDMVGVYSCYSRNNEMDGTEEVFIYVRNGILWKKAVNVFGTKWWIGNIT